MTQLDLTTNSGFYLISEKKSNFHPIKNNMRAYSMRIWKSISDWFRCKCTFTPMLLFPLLYLADLVGFEWLNTFQMDSTTPACTHTVKKYCEIEQHKMVSYYMRSFFHRLHISVWFFVSDPSIYGVGCAGKKSTQNTPIKALSENRRWHWWWCGCWWWWYAQYVYYTLGST